MRVPSLPFNTHLQRSDNGRIVVHCFPHDALPEALAIKVVLGGLELTLVGAASAAAARGPASSAGVEGLVVRLAGGVVAMAMPMVVGAVVAAVHGATSVRDPGNIDVGRQGGGGG